jgi:chlorophyll synthase
MAARANWPQPSADPGIAQAHHLVSADVGLRLRRRVASGAVAATGRWEIVVIGVLLAGPLVCATSQAVNDWFDRHVDAINEPNRPIPSGRMPGYWGCTSRSAGRCFPCSWRCRARSLGLSAQRSSVWLLAWAYSAPPLRLKQNGWWGNTACAVCYEGLAWVTGAP